MKILRDVDGEKLVRALRVLGYAVNRLQGILRGVAAHHRLSVAELLAQLDL